MKKKDERKAEQSDEDRYYDWELSSESSSDDEYNAWGRPRKGETLEDRMKLNQVVCMIENRGLDKYYRGFIRCLMKMYAWGNEHGLQQSGKESEGCRAAKAKEFERFGPSTVDWIARRALWAWREYRKRK